MKTHSRRNFIKNLGAFAGLAFAGRGALAQEIFAENNAKAFDFLVIGDSLVWGQGLREENKFYYLTKQWLERDVFKNSRQVDLKVKAHSGAMINLRDFETAALERAEIGADDSFHPEINIGFPSINSQIEAARKLYKNPGSVDLVMLTGGITDVGLSVILNPLKRNAELRQNIEKHCNEAMSELLARAAENFPNALIVLVGYYPFLSKHTPASRIFNNVLEIYNFPSALKFLINNPLNRQVLRYYRKKMVKRSMIWAENSTRGFKKAVDRTNAGFDTPRIVFVESPITAENSLGAKNSLLYGIEKNGRPKDALAGERKAVCRKTLDELRESTKLKFRTRTCELATIGHPNPAGAKEYAEAVKTALKPFFQTVDRNI